ncbi:LysM peptidoglycan-binding domain-containing protein [Frankia nepalensis]|uniref:LysM peptidoglycan-binding domain-containing protein n=1 Tax=Frankia nepalensis TaxID=1836974 RepID=UPI0027DC5240|nr:LysM domain-containing protein [Frankia nepalensis]
MDGPGQVWPDLSGPVTAPPPTYADPVVPPAPRGIGEPAGAGSLAGQGEVVVLRGDSLWTIAARHLGPAATDAQVASEWRRWWAANRDVIGPDPNLIHPGQRLRPPPGP